MRYALLVHYPQPAVPTVTDEQINEGKVAFNAYARALDAAGVLCSARRYLEVQRRRPVKTRRMNQRIDLRNAQLGHRRWPASASEQLQRHRERHLVAGTNRDHARHELLEYGVMALLGELEHSGAGKLPGS